MASDGDRGTTGLEDGEPVLGASPRSRTAATEDWLDPPRILGDHLDELRRRLILVAVVVGFVFILALIMGNDLKLLAVRPLIQAIAMVSEETRAVLGLPGGGTDRIFLPVGLAESAMATVKLALLASLTVAMPMLIAQIWGFIKPGLRAAERNAGFWMLPAAVLFFYSGLVLGFLYGLPWLMRFLVEWNATDPTIAGLGLRQDSYIGFFALMMLAFGLVLDVPWAVIVLIRTGVVSPEAMVRSRRIIYFVAAIVSAIVTPPDPFSLGLVFIPMVLLFEVGLMAGRMHRDRARARLEDPPHA